MLMNTAERTGCCPVLDLSSAPARGRPTGSAGPREVPVVQRSAECRPPSARRPGLWLGHRRADGRSQRRHRCAVPGPDRDGWGRQDPARADYARAAWDKGDLDVLVWITASARTSVVSGFAQAGVELCQADPEVPEQAAKTFLAWLAPKSGQRPCRWLIVLDDVADPGDLVVHPEDPGNRFSLWPPASRHGRTLLTTRRRDAALFGEGRRRIDVGVFTPAESVAYLTAALHAHGRAEPVDQLSTLASGLGHLPLALALAQAVAYLIDSGATAATYRDLLSDRTTKLTDLAPDVLPDEQATALAAAWSLSTDRADTLRPAGLARPMLHLASLLDANGIPQDVLTSPPACAYLAQHRTVSARVRVGWRTWWPGRPQRPAALVTPGEALGALRALDRLNLIDHQPGAPPVSPSVSTSSSSAPLATPTPLTSRPSTQASPQTPSRPRGPRSNATPVSPRSCHQHRTPRQPCRRSPAPAARTYGAVAPR